MLAETDSSTNRVRLHVRLLDDGTEVARPTDALDLGEGLFRLLPTPDYDPTEETWEFVPGTLVRAEKRKDESGEYLIAVKQ